MINWLEKAQAYKDAFLKDLWAILEIPSIRNDENKSDEAPFGIEVKRALDCFLGFAERDGFLTNNYNNLVGKITYGEGDKVLGIFGHLDVVPVGNGWQSSPFQPTLREGNIYARGIADNKGPLLAAYYGLKIIKNLGLPLKNEVQLLLGTDEENSWQCMDYYKAVEKMPDIAFSPDADFPVINGEKGISNFRLEFRGGGKGMWEVGEFHAGTRPNMVPDKATASIRGKALTRLSEAFSAFISQNEGLDGHFYYENDTLYLECIGKASHGMQPELGLNAGNYLASFLADYDLGQRARSYFQFVKTYLHKEHDGKSFGIDTTHEIMGEVTVNTGILHYDENGAHVILNIRYPLGQTHQAIYDALLNLKHPLSLQKVVVLSTEEPHYVPADDPLVKTLLAVYERQTGNKGTEKSIGGGTYGKLVPRGVAYGAHFPGRDDSMHQKDEHMPLEDLILSIAIYAEAIYELTKNPIEDFISC